MSDNIREKIDRKLKTPLMGCQNLSLSIPESALKRYSAEYREKMVARHVKALLAEETSLPKSVLKYYGQLFRKGPAQKLVERLRYLPCAPKEPIRPNRSAGRPRPVRAKALPQPSTFRRYYSKSRRLLCRSRALRARDIVYLRPSASVQASSHIPVCPFCNLPKEVNL